MSWGPTMSVDLCCPSDYERPQSQVCNSCAIDRGAPFTHAPKGALPCGRQLHHLTKFEDFLA